MWNNNWDNQEISMAIVIKGFTREMIKLKLLFFLFIMTTLEMEIKNIHYKGEFDSIELIDNELSCPLSSNDFIAFTLSGRAFSKGFYTSLRPNDEIAAYTFSNNIEIFQDSMKLKIKNMNPINYQEKFPERITRYNIGSGKNFKGIYTNSIVFYSFPPLKENKIINNKNEIENNIESVNPLIVIIKCNLNAKLPNMNIEMPILNKSLNLFAKYATDHQELMNKIQKKRILITQDRVSSQEILVESSRFVQKFCISTNIPSNSNSILSNPTLISIDNNNGNYFNEMKISLLIVKMKFKNGNWIYPVLDENQCFNCLLDEIPISIHLLTSNIHKMENIENQNINEIINSITITKSMNFRASTRQWIQKQFTKSISLIFINCKIRDYRIFIFLLIFYWIDGGVGGIMDLLFVLFISLVTNGLTSFLNIFSRISIRMNILDRIYIRNRIFFPLVIIMGIVCNLNISHFIITVVRLILLLKLFFSFRQSLLKSDQLLWLLLGSASTTVLASLRIIDHHSIFELNHYFHFNLNSIWLIVRILEIYLLIHNDYHPFSQYQQELNVNDKQRKWMKKIEIINQIMIMAIFLIWIKNKEDELYRMMDIMVIDHVFQMGIWILNKRNC